MTKSKSSTIAIVVLSVLLAAALASTIVLAAFTTSKTATTTITFASGVQMKVASAEATNFAAVNVSGENITLAPTNNNYTGAVNLPVVKAAVNMNSNVTLSISVKFNNADDTLTWNGNVGTSATNGYKITLTSTTFTDTGLSNDANNGVFAGAMTAVTGSDWDAITGSTTTGMTDLYSALVIESTSATYDELAGDSISITLTLDATTNSSL